MTVCHLWPGITPHRSGMPGSVWDLDYGVWLGFAKAADDYIAANKP